jgi:glycosyltransferase involved in cell wall biosynthesis
MGILFVCSGNTNSVFVTEQAESIVKKGIQVNFFYIKGKGFKGYLCSIKSLFNAIKKYKPDIIHAHYGLAGVISNLQIKIPVVTTYHGCDINKTSLRILSLYSLLTSSSNIFVSANQYNKVSLFVRSNFHVIPCGVNLNEFEIKEVENYDDIPYFNKDNINVLFSSDFETPVKNYQLALKAVNLVNEKITLIELKGYNREQVNKLLNLCDLVLMTSIREGSPQIIKEAMACGCPIVTTDVGDVKKLITNIEGCYITNFNPNVIAEKIKIALEFSRKNKRTEGRKKIVELGLNNEAIASKLINVYESVKKKSVKK